ncbi:MAG: two-component system response regulator [Spirochaetales bacterium]|nr:two-component system response regulator [Spirochaetales bacterium]
MKSETPLILIVDDNQQNLKVLGTLLLEENYEVSIAENGKEAILEVETNRPDLILMDIMMPVMDGFEAVEKLKANDNTKNIPIIFVTAMNEDADEEKGFNLGAADYITKPVRGPIVKARVKLNLALNNQKRLLEQQVSERTRELEETRHEIIRRLGRAAEYKDNETGNHIVRMSKVSRIIAEGFGLNNTECELILNASPMHDIGKIGIPDSVLLKPGKLDPEEWEIMKTHVGQGVEILEGHDSSLLKTAVKIALTHHEKWNGSGYPNGLKGEDIPICGRICAVADVFDALTSVRPYKDAWPVEKAVELLKSERGFHFQPELVDIFLSKLPEILDIKNNFTD